MFSIDNFSLDSLFSDILAIEKYYEITFSVGMCAVNMKRILRKERLGGIGCASTYGNALLKKVKVSVRMASYSTSLLQRQMCCGTN